jgi:hypothetical protein
MIDIYFYSRFNKGATSISDTNSRLSTDDTDSTSTNFTGNTNLLDLCIFLLFFLKLIFHYLDFLDTAYQTTS